MLESVEWEEFKVGDLFEIGTGSLLSNNELKKVKYLGFLQNQIIMEY